LFTPGNRRIDADLEVPFFVVDSTVRFPSAVKVETYSRISVRGDRIRRAVAGERGGYELLKGTRRASGKPWEAAYDQSGRLVDFTRVRAQMMRARLDRYGKLEPRLHARVRGGGTDRLSVAVWLRAGALGKPAKDERREARAPHRGEGPALKAYADQARSVVARYGLDSASRKLRVDGAAPVILAE